MQLSSLLAPSSARSCPGRSPGPSEPLVRADLGYHPGLDSGARRGRLEVELEGAFLARPETWRKRVPGGDQRLGHPEPAGWLAERRDGRQPGGGLDGRVDVEVAQRLVEATDQVGGVLDDGPERFKLRRASSVEAGVVGWRGRPARRDRSRKISSSEVSGTAESRRTSAMPAEDATACDQRHGDEPADRVAADQLGLGGRCFSGGTCAGAGGAERPPLGRRRRARGRSPRGWLGLLHHLPDGVAQAGIGMVDGGGVEAGRRPPKGAGWCRRRRWISPTCSAISVRSLARSSSTASAKRCDARHELRQSGRLVLEHQVVSVAHTICSAAEPDSSDRT